MFKILCISRVLLEESESTIHLGMLGLGFARYHEAYARFEGVVLGLLVMHFCLRPHKTMKDFRQKLKEALETELKTEKENF